MDEEEHWMRLFRAARRQAIWLGAADPDNVAGDVLLRLWRTREQVDSRKLSALGRITTRRLVIDEWRTAQKLPTIRLVDGWELPGREDPWPAVDFRLDLEMGLRYLTDKRQAIWVLWERGTRYDEMARALALPLGTVKSRLAHAKICMCRHMGYQDAAGL